MSASDSRPRLREHYESHVRAKLQEIFGYDNPMRIPRLEKVVLNTGLGDAKDNPKLLDSRSGNGTGMAPHAWTCDSKIGKPGVGKMTSSPSP